MKHKLLFYFYLAMPVMFWLATAHATQVQIPAVTGSPGGTVEVPVMIDEIDNLAGIKLVMTYDAKVLHYEKAEKTPHTSSLMHIVNDKKPGLLIVVMAGAQGIQGKDFPLLTLTFRVDEAAAAPGETQLNITHVELMSDKLKAVKADFQVLPLVLQPRVAGTPPAAKRQTDGGPVAP